MDAALAQSAPEPGQAKLGPVKEERVDAVQGCYNQPHVARPLRLEEKRAYRQTPHSTTGCAPAALMFRSPPQDCRYADEQWQPTELDILKTQEKRKQTNV
ncbi:hypothetical protein NDU88_003091 [Pleurodeles waltl]|uniref:Uncharacterized protein n=1 Tax=Pleurodeles waltl TaxID=8319 RepID=A0AAV7TNQ3_PLEWA|nr:hypothetical protein NDU88_003091 [Pleurodeles waltl]